MFQNDPSGGLAMKALDWTRLDWRAVINQFFLSTPYSPFITLFASYSLCTCFILTTDRDQY